MNSFGALLVVSVIIAVVSASGYGGASSSGGSYGGSSSGGSYGGSSSGGSYGGGAATMQAPPCPKNYLFSCQPNLTPAPCSPSHSSGGYGSSGAYSDNVPTVVNAPYNGGYQGYPNFQQQFQHLYGQVGYPNY